VENISRNSWKINNSLDCEVVWITWNTVSIIRSNREYEQELKTAVRAQKSLLPNLLPAIHISAKFCLILSCSLWLGTRENKFQDRYNKQLYHYLISDSKVLSALCMPVSCNLVNCSVVIVSLSVTKKLRTGDERRLHTGFENARTSSDTTCVMDCKAYENDWVLYCIKQECQGIFWC